MEKFMNPPEDTVINYAEGYNFKKHGALMSRGHWKNYRRGFSVYETANAIAAYWYMEGAQYGYKKAMDEARETVEEQAAGRAEVDADDLLRALLNVQGVGDVLGARITEVFERYAEGDV